MLSLALVTLTALHADGGFFRDAGGGAVLLRGVDVAGNAKVPPFRGITDLDAARPAAGARASTSCACSSRGRRTGQPGVYDDPATSPITSASSTRRRQRGIYVVVDFHQDGFSRYVAARLRRRLPQWTLPPTVTPAVPDNGADCADWGTRRSRRRHHHVVGRVLRRPPPARRTRLLAMVARVATALAGRDDGHRLRHAQRAARATSARSSARSTRTRRRAIRAVDPERDRVRLARRLSDQRRRGDQAAAADVRQLRLRAALLRSGVQVTTSWQRQRREHRASPT